MKEEIDLVWMTFDPFRASKQYAVTWETGHGDVRGDCLTGDLISCGTGARFLHFVRVYFARLGLVHRDPPLSD